MSTTLADLPMFAELSAADLQRLAAAARQRRYRAGQVLCSAGDPATDLLVLLSGTARASRVTDGGQQVVLAVYRAVAAFDKLALLDGGPHPATVTAVSDVTIAYLPAATVRGLVAQYRRSRPGCCGRWPGWSGSATSGCTTQWSST